MSRDIPFDDVIIGQELGPVEIPVNEKIVRDYCDEFKDDNPIYLDDSPFGGPVVPPLFQATLHDLRLLGTKWDTHATVPSKTQHELLNPAMVEKRLNAGFWIFNHQSNVIYCDIIRLVIFNSIRRLP